MHLYWERKKGLAASLLIYQRKENKYFCQDTSARQRVSDRYSYHNSQCKSRCRQAVNVDGVCGRQLVKYAEILKEIAPLKKYGNLIKHIVVFYCTP